MVNFNDNINISGPGNAGFGPEGQSGKPIPPPPSPSTSIYLNPSQMSNYLSGPMSDWLEENRTSFSPEDFASAQDNISEAASFLSSSKASAADSISSFNQILSSLGFPLSNEQKADQIDATAQSIDSQARKSFGSLEDSVNNVSSQLETLGRQLDTLQQSSSEPSSLQSASDALSKAQGIMVDVRDSLLPLDDAVGAISETANQISNLASEMHGFASPATMQSLQKSYNSILNGQTNFDSALSEVTSNTTSQLQKVQSLINSQIKPIVEPAPSYSWEDYDNNWGAGGSSPTGASGDLSFAVVNSDGSFDPTYPIGGTGDSGLAIGGYNNSTPGTTNPGLYDVMTQALINGNLTPAQQALLNNIVNAAEQYGYSRVIMDFEDYSDPNPSQTSASYTMFLEQLGNALHAKGIKLEMAISPSITNQTYFNMNTLLSTGCVDNFQVMCYDYEQGSPASTGIASVAQTQAYLEQMLSTYPGLTQSKLMIGFPLYGASYTLPAGLTPQQVLQALESGQGVTFDSGEVGDNTILSDIGSWTNPTNGWVQISDGKTPPTYFYYNPATGKLYNTFPPASMQDFANMMKTNFPNVAGFFAWESSDDTTDNSMFTQMMNDFLSPTGPSFSQAQSQVETWLTNLESIPGLASWAQSLLGQVQSATDLNSLAAALNSAFNPTGTSDIFLLYPQLIGQGTKINNQISDLFSQNPDLVYLANNCGLNIPQVTPADMLNYNLQSWNPDPTTDPSGYAAKQQILEQLFGDPNANPPIPAQGSAWTQAEIKQFYWWPLQPTLDPADAAYLAQIMYANI